MEQHPSDMRYGGGLKDVFNNLSTVYVRVVTIRALAFFAEDHGSGPT